MTEFASSPADGLAAPGTTPEPAAPPDDGSPLPPAAAGRAASLRFAATHTLPAFARGIVSTRPRVLRALSAVHQPAWSAATLRALRHRHHGAPVLLRGLSGPLLVLLDRADAARFFALPVRDLALDAPDKDKCLRLLEPGGVICSHGDLREERRRVNDDVLAAAQPVHPDCETYLRIVADEAQQLMSGPLLTAPHIQYVMERISRRIVLGDAAADDEELTGWLRALRSEANWMGLRKARAEAGQALYTRANARIRNYARQAPGTALAAQALAHDDPSGALDPIGQTHHWLLAVDGTAPVALRTLCLLAAHPAEQDAARADADSGDPRLPRLRDCVAEGLRLYPLVPDLVRVTRAETDWGGVSQPAGTGVLFPAQFHQRDPEHLAAAQLFAPGRWQRPEVRDDPVLAPFSRGPGRCPGQYLGLLLASALCAEVLRAARLGPVEPLLDPHRDLPALLDTAGIRLSLATR